jgi:prepilin-type N-terminal cleavage/methylation domain-containing protein
MGTRGITLVELLVTITLISILTAIASASVKNAKDAAYVAVLESDLENLAIAQEVYHAEKAGYFGEDGGNEGSYTRRMRQLDFKPSHNVRIRMRANKKGWTARAEHRGRRPERFFCSVFIGDVNGYPPASEPGVVTCEPRRRRRRKD